MNLLLQKRFGLTEDISPREISNRIAEICHDLNMTTEEAYRKLDAGELDNRALSAELHGYRFLLKGVRMKSDATTHNEKE